MGVRRVVTGHSTDGRAIVASDEVVESIPGQVLTGFEFFRIWGADRAPRFPDDGSMPDDGDFFPPVGGFRFAVMTFPPDGLAEFADEAVLEAVQTSVAGAAADMESENPGMHTTATIDFEYIVSGSIVLELDDGTEVELHPGDAVIQNGTRHRWNNRGTEPCRMVVVNLGAHHVALG